MSYSYGSDEKSAIDAKFEAQKIAFAPIMFQAARSLIKFGILSAIEAHRKKGLTLSEVVAETGISRYGAKVLLEAGLSMGLVYCRESRYFLTKTAWFLLNDDLTRVNMEFTHEVNYLGFYNLEKAIETGQPEGLKVFGDWPTLYEGLAHMPEKTRESWLSFDHFYSDVSFPIVLPIIFENKVRKLLDVGGNTGKFSIKCASYNPDVHITILDLPGQLHMAEKNIASHGFSDRVTGTPIDLLDHSIPFPGNMDVVWMSQFLDCFSPDDIVQLLKRGKVALNDDGSLYILELFWDQQKFEASTYSLHATSLYFTCIANGCSQMYHHEDMLECIEKAGMRVEKQVLNIGHCHTLLKCVKN